MRRPLLAVKISFEPGRLGNKGFIDAFAQLVPIHRRRASPRTSVVSDKLRRDLWSYRRVSR
jgi:hypothetical protein